MFLSTRPLKQRLYDFGGTKSDISSSDKYDRESALISLLTSLTLLLVDNKFFFVLD